MTANPNPVPPNEDSDLPPEPTDGQRKDPGKPHPAEPKPRETPGEPEGEQGSAADDPSAKDATEELEAPRGDEPGMTPGQLKLERE